MLRLLLLFVLIGIARNGKGQDVQETTGQYRVIGPHLGVGMGLDVGGIIGVRFSHWATPYLAGFIGGGWALVKPGWSAGIELRVPTKGRATPFAVAMYGYNAGIWIKGKEELDEIYFGPTVGAGMMLRQRITRNYWRFSINVPFRDEAFYNHWNYIRSRPDIEIKQDVLPITLGVGFHLCLAPLAPERRAP